MNLISTAPKALWHMAEQRDETGRFELAVHGDVRLGVELEGAERTASLARGGNGIVARMNGGYLSIANDADFAIGDGPFSIAVRLRDPEGLWRYPILGSYGSDREVSVALHAVDGAGKPMVDRHYVGGECPTIYSWMFEPNGPRSVPGTTSLIELVWGAQEPDAQRVQRIRSLQPEATWPNPLQQDVFNAVMKPCFPAGLIGPTDWHEIVATMTGPKLQLWIDGVLVDEEFPLGRTRDRALPFLIGAGHRDGKLVTGFKGLIDHVAVWDRALNPAEIATLSGGPEHVLRREREILGVESPTMQYFRPRGHNRKAGDLIPYWDAQTDTLRMFYLILRRNMHSKWDGGHGGLEIWQASTKDLRDWTHHPVTIPITEQWEAWNGTGAVAFHDGVYHWFYPTPDYGGPHNGIQHATSTDGVHFTKQPPHPFMAGGEVFEDQDGVFHMLKAGPALSAKTDPVRDKTLVAWVRLADLDQRGGSVLTIEHPDGGQFDGIVFGESVPRRWMPGSNNLLRTPPGHVQQAWPEETAGPDQVVQIAAVYAGTRITLYRNGVLYGTGTMAEPITFPAGSSVIIGKRHTWAAPATAFFHGRVLDARLYEGALSVEQLRGLSPDVPGRPAPLAWYDFAEDGTRDRVDRFPDGMLFGGARALDGELVLPGGGHMKAPGVLHQQVRLTSTDLVTWTQVDEPVIASDEIVGMCPNLFRFGDWYYYLASGFWKSRKPFGPWTRHEPHRIDSLGVPKTAAFGEHRRIYAGFLDDGGWGGNSILRELVQDEAGDLGTRFVPELIPACGDDLPLALPDGGNAVTVTANDVLIPRIAGDYRLQVEIVPSPATTVFGIGLFADADGSNGCDLTFEPRSARVRFSRMSRTGSTPIGGPSIEGVRDLTRPFRLDLIVRHDIVDAEIAEFRSLTTRFWRPEADALRLFANGGPVTFRDLRVRRITETYTPYPEQPQHSEHE
jgi:hypothetical protein